MWFGLILLFFLKLGLIYLFVAFKNFSFNVIAREEQTLINDVKLCIYLEQTSIIISVLLLL